MSGPGMSIFQAAESLHINNSIERQQEEEEIEDQKRRNEELGNLLQNAFDDLEEEDEDEEENTTADSTSNLGPMEYNNNNMQQSPIWPLKNRESEEIIQPMETPQSIPMYDANGVHQLQMLLESRTRELENIKHLATDEFKKRDEMEKRLKIIEAELDRTVAAKQNTHELLVECKEKCSNLESTINKLRNEKKTLEVENNGLLGKLETTQMMLADIQQKYDMVQRDLNLQNDRTADFRRKQIEDRHRGEIAMIQQQIEQLADKLDRKTTELENMNTRYHALQSSHEHMLVEKTTRINELSHALTESQKKCEELFGKQDYFQENVRLQKVVASLQEQIRSMEKTIATLNERIDCTAAEINMMDSVLQQHNMEETPQLFSHTNTKMVGSTPMNTVERVRNLKEELYRALAHVKQKRDELSQMQQKMNRKDEEIRVLKEEENNSLVQINILKERNGRLEGKLKALEAEYEQLSKREFNKTETEGRTMALQEEIDRLKEEKARVTRERDDLEQQRLQLEMEHKKIDGKLKNVEVDMEELKQEYESMKRNHEEILKENENLRNRRSVDNDRLELERHKFLLKDAQIECDRLKNLYVQISNAKDELSYELEKMRKTDTVKELHEEREKWATLQRALQLAEVKCSELAKLLESEKLSHEREITTLKEQFEKDKAAAVKAAKESSNNCTKCMDYMAEITKFEIDNLKLNNTVSIHQKEIDDLRGELARANDLVSELNEKLKLCEHQENLIKDLKAKAHKFEEFIKSQSSSDKSVSTSPELARTEMKRVETRVREEMGKIFASELKAVQDKLQEADDKNGRLQREFKKLASDLERRQKEVELLKEAILAERERMNEMLREKDKDHENVLKKHKAMLVKCRDELKEKTDNIKMLKDELEDRQAQIEAERKSMKAVMTQWETQRKELNEVENEWRTKVEELKKSHKTTLNAFHTKYNSAKHTALNYKRYAEEKEAHMLKEYERLKLSYEESLAKIEERLIETMDKKERELRETKALLKKQSPPDEVDGNKENKSRNNNTKKFSS